MKRIFTLLLGSLFSISLLAADANRLSVSTVSKNMDLTIEVDGRRVAMKDNAITLRNLSEGYHNVKIFAEKKRNGNGNGNAYGRNRQADVIYNNSVFIKRGFHLDITVNRFGKVLVDERRMDRNDEWYSDDEYFDYNDGGWDNSYRDVINTREFDQVKQALSKEWLEANRMKSAKFIIDQNSFSTAQVRELMMLFTFENNRLDIAKYAYRKTVDKRSYYQLNDALSFSSSRDELARYIRDFRF
ncbi:MAG TPA: DUF4476 domain-containing protein [Chitinophagaceae bacterium]